MEIYAIGDREYSVYICAGELGERNIDPSEISAIQAAELLRKTLPGVDGSTQMQVELFPGRDELLIFVHLGETAPVFFAFPDGESLIGALTECGADCPAFLTYISNMYILTLYPFRAGEKGLGFEEFGCELDKKPEFALFLREHGEFTLENSELKALKSLFSAKKN